MSANCPNCGAALRPGVKNCTQCGAQVGGQPAPRAPRRGFSIWWVIIPTLLYAYLSRDPVRIAILTAIGVGLVLAQRRPEVPASARPYLPLLQLLMVFIFLGGNPIVVVLVAAAVVAVAWQSKPLVRALEPWWQIQQRIPSILRRVIGFLVALVIGYYFGRRAGGNEWTYTFISMVCSTVVVLLLTFKPPATLRRPA